jgi:hypothetical protein
LALFAVFAYSFNAIIETILTHSGNFNFFSNIFWHDVICGHSLVGSNARGPPVCQALSPYQISSQYLQRLSSSRSDTIKILHLKKIAKIGLPYQNFIEFSTRKKSAFPTV